MILRTALAITLTAMWALSAHAQDVTNPSPPFSINGAYNASPPTCVNGHGCWLQTDVNGKLKVDASVSASVAVDTITSNTPAKVTIAVTNTYQQALASSGTRKGCLLQNNGTNTAYVFFGTAPADTTTSFRLTAGQGIACAVGGLATLGTEINVTGTAGDVIVVSSQ